MNPTVPIVRLPHAADLPLPAYESAQAAGMDLRAAVPEDEPLVLRPGSRFPVPTGLAFALPVVPISNREQRAFDVHAEVDGGSRFDLGRVHVPAEPFGHQ